MLLLDMIWILNYLDEVPDAGGVVVSESLLVLPDVGEVGVTRSDEGPPEQLEGGLVAVEELGPVVVVNLVHVHSDQGEADVHNQEDEEKDKDVDYHVGHWDDDRASLSPHQPSLQ